MIPKSHRLPLDQPLSGKSYHSEHARIIIRARSQAPSRVGVVVSKKTAPLAVNRNKLKRKISHALIPFFHTTPPLDIVVIAKPAAATASYHQIATDLKQLIQNYPADKP